jgi:hypothetical protein
MFCVRAAVGDAADSDELAGRYRSDDGYNETRQYDPAARIYIYMVDLSRQR